MSPVCSSAPHSQAAAEEAIPHLYKQERKRPTLVRRWLNRTQALPGRVIPGVCVPVSEINVRSLVGFTVSTPQRKCPMKARAPFALLLKSVSSGAVQVFATKVYFTWKLYLFLERQYQPVPSFLLTAAIFVYPCLQLEYSLCTSHKNQYAEMLFNGNRFSINK